MSTVLFAALFFLLGLGLGHRIGFAQSRRALTILHDSAANTIRDLTARQQKIMAENNEIMHDAYQRELEARLADAVADLARPTWN